MIVNKRIGVKMKSKRTKRTIQTNYIRTQDVMCKFCKINPVTMIWKEEICCEDCFRLKLAKEEVKNEINNLEYSNN